jgi:hypothetical protein
MDRDVLLSNISKPDVIIYEFYDGDVHITMAVHSQNKKDDTKCFRSGDISVKNNICVTLIQRD